MQTNLKSEEAIGLLKKSLVKKKSKKTQRGHERSKKNREDWKCKRNSPRTIDEPQPCSRILKVSYAKPNNKSGITLQPSPLVKKLIQQTLNELHLRKELSLKQFKTCIHAEETKKQTLDKLNALIRRRNHKSTSTSIQTLHKKAWGVDQKKQLAHSPKPRLKTSRKQAKKGGRAHIGLEYFKLPKQKPQLQTCQTEPALARKPDPRILRYMQSKQKQVINTQATQRLEEVIKHSERQRALYKVDLKAKQALKLSKHTRLKKTQPGSATLPRFNSQKSFEDKHCFSSEEKPQHELIQEFENRLHQGRETLKAKLENLRMKAQEVPFSEQYVVKIQRWWRSVLAIAVVTDMKAVTSEVFEGSERSSAELDASSPIFYQNTHISNAFSESTEPVAYSVESLNESQANSSVHHQSSESLELPLVLSDSGQTMANCSQETEFLLTSEINSYLSIVSFRYLPPEVDPSVRFIEQAFSQLSEELLKDELKILDIINTPLYPDPIEQLFILQHTNIGALMKIPNLDFIIPPRVGFALQEKFNTLDIESRNVYLQLIYDCANEALNYLRPYGIEGVPPPWSSKTIQVLGEGSLENILNKARQLVVKWSTLKAGVIHGENNFLRIRDENMSRLLCADAIEDNEAWTKFEDEEMQVTIDCADSILGQAIEEMLELCSSNSR